MTYLTKNGVNLARCVERQLGDVNPENIIWIFGAGRTGSSWLSFMMRDLPDHARWNEPLVGYLFGHLYYERGGHRKDSENFVLGNEYRKDWTNVMRALILDGANARFPEMVGSSYLVIKEPHGSIGAPLLMEALSESRMILLVRDPRDVAASALDGQRKGNWAHEALVRGEFGHRTAADEDPDSFVEERAKTYLRDMSKAKEAYDAHQGRKSLVRYENLRADTLGTMKRLYSELGIPVEEEELVRTVQRHAWENIPESEKGEGKIRRKAKPGGWREDLTPEQARTVERITAPLLNEFYPDGTARR